MEELVIKITDDIYKAYGSDTGFLFGIPPNLRNAVEGVVKAVLVHDEICPLIKK